MIRNTFILLYIAILYFLISSTASQNKPLTYLIPVNQTLARIYADDLNLDFTQLTEKYKYPSEKYTVVTEDGYILTLFRILSKCPYAIGYPVVLMHGIFDSSEGWIFTGPDESVAYVLADNCYDVWVANSRGNTYSRQHLKLNPDKDSQFWDFSFDENGMYDLPAIIDFVINATNKNKIYYIGISQGTTMFFAMTSLRPEYNSKIKLSILIAPVAWLKHVDPLLNLAASTREVISGIFMKLGVEEVFARHQLVRQMAVFLCQIRPFEICGTLLNLLTGQRVESIRPKLLVNGIGHLFAGTSAKSLNHYAQLIQSQRFQRFDEGKEGNLRRYGVDPPPEYNLSVVTSPIVLMCGKNDFLSDLKNIKILSKKLPNLVDVYVVPDPTWSHSDYLWNKNAAKYVRPKILEYFNNYNNL